ncbi:MAG: transcriptional regulator, AraC family [Thermoleophilia bacterium]|nr:transcriptional regulator, AraC family [Thermoleophilia bacterium]
MLERITSVGAIPIDRLIGDGPAVQIIWVDAEHPLETGVVREAHRHDYHELFFVGSGTMEHRIDGELVRHAEGSALLVGRGQVHVLERATDLDGVVVRFSEDMLTGAAQQASPGWMLVQARSCVMEPPATERAHLTMLLRMLDDELQRAPDARSGTLQAYYLSAVLLLIARWQGEQPDDDTAGQTTELILFQSFGRLLEAEYAQHHDATWYAHQLAISPGHLASMLTRLTGRSTKKLISDRLMTEAQRLLRHTNLTVQQVAQRVGYDDPLYFSRAFRQHVGEPPSAYREHVSG